jgi:glyoxylase-like metal-dependent hydrolase (beta-lactamase superfamily II)
VWVHEVGVRHLADPTRLIASTREVYGDRFAAVWGEILPVPPDRIRTIDAEMEVPGARAIPSPGHCRHHAVFMAADGTLYAGDAAGVAWTGAPSYVDPPTPPPDPDPDAWRTTIARLRALAAERVAITHFGVFGDVARHLDALERTLEAWVERSAGTEAAFVAAAHADRRAACGDWVGGFWEQAATASWSYAGLRRWRERTGQA